MRTGYFDGEGKCLVILSGHDEPPSDLVFAYTAEVPEGLSPNTCEVVDGKLRKKERVLPVRPPRPDKLAPIEARLAALEAKIK